MKTRALKFALAAVLAFTGGAASLGLVGCAASTHAAQPATMGAAHRSADMLAVIDQPGPIEVESVVSTEWAVTRAGLINLDSPKAKEAHLTDGDEPIQVYFHVVHHPRFGMFIIDTGVERALRDAPDQAAMRGLIAREMHREKMDFAKPLGDWLAAQHEPLRGVFFTHLHLDHVSGAPDLPKSTALYAGPGETTARGFMNVFTQGTVDRALSGLPPVGEWRYQPDADGRFAGVLDVFGDGSFWAIWTPGHTPGSTAYLARTAKGPVLFTGDTSHTRWGWENGVEPGEFTADHEKNKESLARLRKLVEEHPAIDVRLGHQHAH
jgi:glyoxylase-like metal-dependent hydrolase (beta-lactamase superfamily II)